LWHRRLRIIAAAGRSLMATTVFWAAGAYNNGILPYQHSRYSGEAYTREGQPAKLVAGNADPGNGAAAWSGLQGAIPCRPGGVPARDVFIFEHGERNTVTQFPEIGNPNSRGRTAAPRDPGVPDIRQSNRGPGPGCACRSNP
jgi:hypothetical protein